MGEPKFYEWPALDLKIEEWQSIAMHGYDLAKRLSLKNLRSKEIRGSYEAFLNNTQDYCGLAGLPGGVFVMGRKVQLAEVAACMTLYGSPVPPRLNPQIFDPRPPREAAELRDTFVRDEGKPPFPIWVGASTKDAFDYSLRFDQMRFATLMASQLVSCWTAFETLATDLWVDYLNARPQLGYTALTAILQADKGDADLKKKLKFPITLEQLEECDFNLKPCMGSILRSHPKLSFASLDGLAATYTKAFGRGSPELEAAFDGRNLRTLNAVRNLLVHRAGVVDAEFKGHMTSHPRFGSVPVGERIAIDGSVCVELITAGCDRAIDLIQFVDGWLVSNSSP